MDALTTLTEFYPSEEKYAILLGAGFSKWAVNLPTVNDLFDYKIRIWGIREKSKLGHLKRLKEVWDSENTGENPEEFISYAYEKSENDKHVITWYIARRLSDPFIWEERRRFSSHRHVLMIDEYRKNGIVGLKNAKNFINSLQGPQLSGIITTNYDLVVEYALGTKGFNYGTRFQALQGRGPYPVSTWLHPVILRGDLSLAKIHGSISWTEEGHFTDGRGGITGKALIVPPVLDKPKLKLLEDQWNLS